MKRLRRHYEPAKIRFFQCGEYGERNGRPHHHYILFGEDFSSDRTLYQTSQSGLPQYTSATLDTLWGHGLCTIGDVTFESAAYVARYVLKKVSGDGKDAHYNGRLPEFVTMSRRPGIGALWLQKHQRDVYPGDLFVPGDGRPASLPPKYFDKLLAKTDPALFKRVEDNRKKSEIEQRIKFQTPFLAESPHDPETSPHRLMVREELKTRTIKDKLKRDI